MAAYYNEHDPFAAQWLRELMADDLIAPGDVDERSIEDVTPSELAGYTQCHFFAGIGVWSLALRLAGWRDDRPIWTGSCPCQPFSAAGKGGGFADERHLWPAFHWLIGECRPAIVVGEQVSSDYGLAWIDLVLADLDQSGYACGALDTCAAGFGAPHIRQRLYWMGYADDRGLQGRRCAIGHDIWENGQTGSCGPHSWMAEPEDQRHERTGLAWRWRDGPAHVSDARGMADAGCGIVRSERFAMAGTARGSECEEDQRERLWADARDGDDIGGMADAERERERHATGSMGNDTRETESYESETGRQAVDALDGSADLRPGPANGYWRNADWLRCRDGKWRPVSPGTFPLVTARSVRNLVGALRGAGNALNVAQAQGFIEAVITT